MKKILVSIIVPVYNCEKYLSSCIEHLLNQTYKNIEIILINDGSIDNSWKIITEYSKKDKRIIPVNQENSGANLARKKGIEICSGDYIMFVDSDDYIKENTIEELYNIINEYNADIVKYGFTNKNNSFIDNLGKDINIYENDCKNELYNKLLTSITLNNITTEIIKRDIIDISMPVFNLKSSSAEDLQMNLELFDKAERIIVTKYKFYYYRDVENSTTHTFNYKTIIRNIKQNEQLYDSLVYYSKKWDLYSKLYDSICARYTFFCLNSIIKIIGSDTEIKNELLNELNEIIDLLLPKKVNPVLAIKNSNINKLKKCVYYLVLHKRFKLLKNMISIKNVLSDFKKKDIDVGICTLYGNNNFGNKLQNYALQEKIKSYGFSTITFKLNNYSIKGSIYNLLFFYKKKETTNEILRKEKFYSFNKLISYSKKKVNIYYPIITKRVKYLVYGSDQIWNPNFGGISKFFSGRCGRVGKSSYSASFGVDELSANSKKIYKSGLNTFDNISVREERGKELAKELTDRNDIEVVIDPTMLLTAEEWDIIATKPKNLKSDKYILCYFLGALSQDKKLEIERVAKELDCKIINLLDKNDPLYVSSPSDFLYLEKHASLICTDSFHSSVFAILYNRPFVVFERESKVTSSMNSRIDTLISKFNLKNRVYNGEKITLENINHDYEEAYRILSEERIKSDKYIEKILSFIRK